MEVLCDSSFLMTIVSSRTTCQDKLEYELGPLKFIVPLAVIDELEKIKQRGGPKRSKIAESAIQIANLNFEIKKIGEIGYHVDELLIEYATKNNCAVATLDYDLLKRLIKNDVLVITLSNNRMMIANHYRP